MQDASLAAPIIHILSGSELGSIQELDTTAFNGHAEAADGNREVVSWARPPFTDTALRVRAIRPGAPSKPILVSWQFWPCP